MPSNTNHNNNLFGVVNPSPNDAGAGSATPMVCCTVNLRQQQLEGAPRKQLSFVHPRGGGEGKGDTGKESVDGGDDGYGEGEGGERGISEVVWRRDGLPHVSKKVVQGEENKKRPGLMLRRRHSSVAEDLFNSTACSAVENDKVLRQRRSGTGRGRGGGERNEGGMDNEEEQEGEERLTPLVIDDSAPCSSSSSPSMLSSSLRPSLSNTWSQSTAVDATEAEEFAKRGRLGRGVVEEVEMVLLSPPSSFPISSGSPGGGTAMEDEEWGGGRQGQEALKGRELTPCSGLSSTIGRVDTPLNSNERELLAAATPRPPQQKALIGLKRASSFSVDHQRIDRREGMGGGSCGRRNGSAGYDCDLGEVYRQRRGSASKKRFALIFEELCGKRSASSSKCRGKTLGFEERMVRMGGDPMSGMDQCETDIDSTMASLDHREIVKKGNEDYESKRATIGAEVGRGFPSCYEDKNFRNNKRKSSEIMRENIQKDNTNHERFGRQPTTEVRAGEEVNVFAKYHNHSSVSADAESKGSENSMNSEADFSLETAQYLLAKRLKMCSLSGTP
eukprot:Nk52_evm85s210 gene=Nk52_evmTU85s210